MAAPFRTNRHIRSANRTSDRREWRCRKCFKLLGCRSERGVHVNFSRGHQYIVSAPVTAVCRCCGTLNELHQTN